jgi:exodeoxyribonuclease V alpha subunit
LSDEGHVCFPQQELITRAAALLEAQAEAIQQALNSLENKGRIVIERSPTLTEDASQVWIYLNSLHASEIGVARRLAELWGSPNQLATQHELASDESLAGLGFIPSPDQSRALELILRSKIGILTGGPGTGKTTLLKILIRILQGAGIFVALAAPTGRAARRLSEATGWEAKTLHRLLEYGRGISKFLRNRENPLEAQFVIVDEASMVDIVLMYHLLDALPDQAHLLMVGDSSQLPSVGPGNVLADMIASKQIPTATLTLIFRQAESSRIVISAHLINEGSIPEIKTTAAGELSDFYFIEEEDPQKVLDKIRQLVQERIPRRFRLHPIRDIQVITPMHRGEIGAESLNEKLREWLNPARAAQARSIRGFRVGDKVMQIRNNYDKDVFNGDIGRIEHIDVLKDEVRIQFDGQSLCYTEAEMEEVAPAYAITVHKSQGSEYPAVILPLLGSHYMMLQRNLLYTAVTRARKLMVLIGSKSALLLAVRNNRRQQRCTLLKERIIQGFDA